MDAMMHLFDLMVSVWDMVRSGKRKAEEVAKWLQVVKDDPEFVKSLEHSNEIKALLTKAQVFYKKHFGMECDFSGLYVPPKPAGKYWLIVVARGMNPNQIYAACLKAFNNKCWKSREDLSVDPEKEERKADRDYAVWVKAVIEADEDLKNKSANDIKAERISSNTLNERLLLGLQRFDEDGNHLDIVNITLCSGSRYLDGSVPDVLWSGGKMFVFRYCADSRDDLFRSRAVVS